MNNMLPLARAYFLETIDSALTALAALALQVRDSESALDMRIARSALTFYRLQRCPDEPFVHGPVARGSHAALLRLAAASLGRLLADGGNSKPQAAVLRACRERVETVARRTEERAAEELSRCGICNSLPAGDRPEPRASVWGQP